MPSSSTSHRVSRDESTDLPQFKTAITEENHARISFLLELRPALPRLLLNSKGKCDQDFHEHLFALLLVGGRIRDLERLYGVLIADLDNESGELPSLDGDEAVAQYETISQREPFGSRVAILHERICARRSSSSGEVNPPAQQFDRLPVRNLSISRLLGRGSYGYVYTSGRGDILKYSTMTSEYVRELLTQRVLQMTSEDLPGEVSAATSVMPDHVHHHLLSLTEFTPLTAQSIAVVADNLTRKAEGEASLALHGLGLTQFDRLAILVRSLFNGVRALRDRFVMHLDISTTNVMWEEESGGLRVIDYGGTIGDDSFLDLGHIVPRLCTRSTRAPEYASSETLWQRNESSETLGAYYAVMSHAFKADLLKEQPFSKEAACAEQVALQTNAWNEQWRRAAAGSTSSLPTDIECMRRVHMAARSLPRDRPPLDWLLSDGTDACDRLALEMGCIGSAARFAHVKGCLSRFISQWPRGVPLDTTQHTTRAEWMQKRVVFITMLVSRISCGIDGSTCGGLLDRMVPPPYITSRCISLYDALRDIVLGPRGGAEDFVEEILVRYLTETSCYPLLVNAILYVALSPCKALLVEVAHYANHPLHVILRTFLTFPHLVSLFLSPITAASLLLLETPRSACGLANDEAASVIRRSAAPVQPRAETSHRILRCLYNLRCDRRCRPMNNPSIGRVAAFVRIYLVRLFREPNVFTSEDDWWRFLRMETTTPESTVDLPSEWNLHIESIIRLWFT